MTPATALDVARAEQIKSRYVLTCRLVDALAAKPTATTLQTAANAFNFARQFPMRHPTDRALDFVPILAVAEASATGLTTINCVGLVEGLADQLAALPGVVRPSRSNGKTPRPVSAASVILSLFAPEVVIPVDHPSAAALRALGYVSAHKGYRDFTAAFATEVRKRSSELEAAATILTGSGEHGRAWTTRFLMQEWLRFRGL